MHSFERRKLETSVDLKDAPSEPEKKFAKAKAPSPAREARALPRLSFRTKAGRHEIFGAARHDQFLCRGTQRGKGERFSIECENGFGIIDRNLWSHGRRRAIGECSAQVRYQLGTLKYHEAVVERVALVGFGKTGGDDARNPLELQRRSRLLATGPATKVEAAYHDVAAAIEGVEVRIVIFKCHRRHLLGRHVVAVSMFAAVNAVGVQIVLVDEENATTHAWREAGHDLDRSRRLRFSFGTSNSGACRSFSKI